MYLGLTPLWKKNITIELKMVHYFQINVSSIFGMEHSKEVTMTS